MGVCFHYSYSFFTLHLRGWHLREKRQRLGALLMSDHPVQNTLKPMIFR